MHRQLLGVTAVAAVSVAVVAQEAGGIRGVVFDKDFDVPLVGATVQLVEAGRKVLSSDFGNFVFNDLRPGSYTVVAAKDGYVRQLRAVVVEPGKLVEVRIELVGDFTDMEPYVVQDALQVGGATESVLLDLRLESPSMMDSISSELMSKANAGDAVGALRLVAGASTQDGKSAVIRGLPDRYVSSQMNGVLLPTADSDKRAVELDQFPAEVIQSLQVSKTFTPDQVGNASGGAVNLVLKGVPDQPFFMKWKTGTAYNSQTTGRNDFLSYADGGVHAFGKGGDERFVQELGENWAGAVGVDRQAAPIDYNFSGSLGGRVELGGDWRAGGFVNVFYKRDAGYSDNGRDDSMWALQHDEPLTPQTSQGTPTSGEFVTSLLDITRGEQSVQWGALATAGIANDDHALTFSYLWTRKAQDKATLAEDTRGKQYFFPGHDPDVPTSPGYDQYLAAPWLRLQTLEYEERTTVTSQLNGRHRFEATSLEPFQAIEFDWTLAHSEAERDQPDKRQFADAWAPSGVYLPFKPAAQFTLGNMQRVFETTRETSDEVSANVKLPFEAWNGNKGYVKFGVFRDSVDRTFDQDTFSNFSDPNQFFNGQWDEFDWADSWLFQDHLVTASDTDVDYAGRQVVEASYVMLDLPLHERLRLIGGLRVESTDIRTTNTPEADALWVPPGQFGVAQLLPGDGDVSFHSSDKLPSVSLVWDPVERVTCRVAYNETVARQTFKELTPIFQQEYLGGPVFVGNPDLEMSSVRNYDLRVDWVPYDGGLFSASWFKKDIEQPIEYVEKLALYSFTTAVNYPRGTLSGFELETRQDLGHFAAALRGIGVGANATLIDGRVNLPDAEIGQFEALHGVRPPLSRDMTNAPEHLYNFFVTYEIDWTKTAFGVFYTVQGDTLVQGPGPSNDFFVPATYQTEFDTLTASVSQALGDHVKLTIAGKNLTDPERRQVYRSPFVPGDTLRRSHTDGVEWSVSIGGEITF
ncbi:MAG: TonB-dependent receptor [Planctomycetes bacterium]|nr:TonB-dependent receptor [Planctomycetota bacterium]